MQTGALLLGVHGKPHPKHPCACWGWLPVSCNPASLQEPGETAQPWGFVPCVAKTPSSCRRDRLSTGWLLALCTGNAHLNRFLFYLNGFFVDLCPSQLSLGDSFASGSFALSKADIVQTQVTELTVITLQSFNSLVFLLLLSSFLPRWRVLWVPLCKHWQTHFVNEPLMSHRAL